MREKLLLAEFTATFLPVVISYFQLGIHRLLEVLFPVLGRRDLPDAYAIQHFHCPMCYAPGSGHRNFDRWKLNFGVLLFQIFHVITILRTAYVVELILLPKSVQAVVSPHDTGKSAKSDYPLTGVSGQAFVVYQADIFF